MFTFVSISLHITDADDDSTTRTISFHGLNASLCFLPQSRLLSRVRALHWRSITPSRLSELEMDINDVLDTYGSDFTVAFYRKEVQRSGGLSMSARNNGVYIRSASSEKASDFMAVTEWLFDRAATEDCVLPFPKLSDDEAAEGLKKLLLKSSQVSPVSAESGSEPEPTPADPPTNAVPLESEASSPRASSSTGAKSSVPPVGGLVSADNASGGSGQIWSNKKDSNYNWKRSS